MVLIMVEGTWRSLHELEDWSAEQDVHASLALDGSSLVSVQTRCRCGHASVGHAAVVESYAEVERVATAIWRRHAVVVGEIWF